MLVAKKCESVSSWRHATNHLGSLICREEGEALAKQLNLRYFRTSVKDNTNIEEGKYSAHVNSVPNQFVDLLCSSR